MQEPTQSELDCVGYINAEFDKLSGLERQEELDYFRPRIIHSSAEIIDLLSKGNEGDARTSMVVHRIFEPDWVFGILVSAIVKYCPEGSEFIGKYASITQLASKSLPEFLKK
jgi:hypothetical protein